MSLLSSNSMLSGGGGGGAVGGGGGEEEDKVPWFVIDYKGFKGFNEQTVIKEVSILKASDYSGSTIVKHFIFKAPYPLWNLPRSEREGVQVAERYEHGLGWNSVARFKVETLDYSRLREVINRNVFDEEFPLHENVKVYVYDEAVAEFLRDVFGSWIDVNIIVVERERDCLNIKQLADIGSGFCPAHYASELEQLGTNNNRLCSLKIVNALHEWISRDNCFIMS
jgi:hypothetical protein